MRTDLIKKSNSTQAEIKLSYGIDHIEGLFLEIFINGVRTVFRSARQVNGLTMQEVVDAVEEYGFDISYELDMDGDRFAGSGCYGGCEHCQHHGI